MTDKMKIQLNENITQIIKWFQENADTEDSIIVDYNYSNTECKYNDFIRVPKNGGTPESGNLWGYHTTFTRLDKLQPYEMLEIIEQWQDIKERFLEEKQEQIDKRNRINDCVFNFKL